MKIIKSPGSKGPDMLELIFLLMGSFFALLGGIFAVVGFAERNSFWGGDSVFLIVGLMFVLFGVLFLSIVGRHRARLRRVIKEGAECSGIIVSQGRSESSTVDGVPELVIEVYFKDPYGTWREEYISTGSANGMIYPVGATVYFFVLGDECVIRQIVPPAEPQPQQSKREDEGLPTPEEAHAVQIDPGFAEEAPELFSAEYSGVIVSQEYDHAKLIDGEPELVITIRYADALGVEQEDELHTASTDAFAFPVGAEVKFSILDDVYTIKEVIPAELPAQQGAAASAPQSAPAAREETVSLFCPNCGAVVRAPKGGSARCPGCGRTVRP